MTRTALYRHYDADSRLLYVGIAVAPLSRLSGHAKSHWADDIARIEIEWHADDQLARDEEARQIQRLKPLHNRSRSTLRYARLVSSVPDAADFAIIHEIDEYARRTGQSVSTMCARATGDPRKRDRLLSKINHIRRDVKRLRKFMADNPPTVTAANNVNQESAK